MKAIYMSACVAATPLLRERLMSMIDETELNTVMIDIKDYSGTISFNTGNPELAEGEAGEGCRVSDMEELIAQFHEKDIYVIGRVTVFQDPLYSKLHPELAVKKESNRNEIWSDHKGLHFIEVGAKEYWKYVVTLARESYAIGFDEINFDYIRFPSDGDMYDIYYPFSNDTIESDPDLGKAKVLREFFEYLHGALRNEMPVSADIFGMTTTNTNDLNIGQILEYTLPYFDYVAPMVYPSHYPGFFLNLGDPNKHVYTVVNHSMSEAVRRVNVMKSASSTPVDVRDRLSPLQLRPWLQDFDYGGEYGVFEVQEQIRATYEAGLTSWFLWDPANRYTRGALLEG